jgi:TRAP-type C4-dicarboxylate transport system permease small subunit
MLSPPWRFVLKAIVTIPLLIFLGLMVVNGYSYASRFTHQTLPALDFLWSSVAGRDLGLSVRWVYISVAVGCALLAMHLVLSLFADARELVAHRQKALSDPAE